MPPVKRPISPHASRLSRQATDAEQRLWSRLRNRGLAGYKFKRQHAIGPCIADFVCLERKLIVEVDGSQHNEQVDRARTNFFGRGAERG